MSIICFLNFLDDIEATVETLNIEVMQLETNAVLEVGKPEAI